MKAPAAVLTFAVFASSVALAAEPKTVEELAVISDLETARLDPLSIRRFGDDARFDVGVGWRDPARRPPGEAATRVVQYVAKCKDGTLALASVSTSDEQGRPLKRYLVPPGSADAIRPPPDSQEAAWLEKVCSRN
jgi:hypothetical protein